jgi:hypothetical protein
MINRIFNQLIIFVTCFFPIWLLYNVIVSALQLESSPLLHGFRMFLTLIGAGLGLLVVRESRKGIQDTNQWLMILATYVAGISGLEFAFKVLNFT